MPISMPLYIMLCIMLAYIMLFSDLSNAVCLHSTLLSLLFFFLLPLIFENAFSFHVLSWFIDTLFVYFMYYYAFAVLLICWSFLMLCSHRFFFLLMTGLCALCRNST